MANFKEIIKQLRLDHNYSQLELAQALNVSKSTIAMWETGKRYPSNSTYENLANFFHVDMDYLYGRTEFKTKEEMLQHFDDTIDTSALQSDIFRVEVGSRIKNARENKNMSMKTLGEKVNLHESTISKYEKGEIQVLDVEKMKEFASALDISPSYLMGLEVTTDDKSIIDGNLLKTVREKNNITAYEIASELGISVQELFDYESGVKPITYDILEKYAKYLGVNVSLLQGLKYVQHPNENQLQSVMRILDMTKRWNEEVGVARFTDEELDELINFAKYLVSKRKKDGEK